MKIGFYTVGTDTNADHFRCAALLIASIRRNMPGVPIAQLTDTLSAAAPGVDEVYRLEPRPMALMRPAHYAARPGDWLFLDTDILIRADVADVFAQRFDVAFADRDWPHMEPTPKLTARMPYNAGVAFSRAPEFWRRVEAAVRARPEKWAGSFMGDQAAIAHVARHDMAGLELVELPGMRYNYPPTSRNDPGILNAAIVHFKGKRKPWMLG